MFKKKLRKRICYTECFATQVGKKGQVNFKLVEEKFKPFSKYDDLMAPNLSN